MLPKVPRKNAFILLILALLFPLVNILYPALPTLAADQPVKYIFLFIGDGMGVAQRDATELFLAVRNGAKPGTWQETRLLMNTFPAQGMTTTYDAGSTVTDSASAGTAIATGEKTLNGVISMDVKKTKKLTTIAEIVKQKGWKVGIVTTVSIDHATPAVFYAHTPSRKNYYDIGVDLIKSGFDYFAGGPFLEPAGKSGSYLNLYDLAKRNDFGYKVVKTRADFDQLAPGAGKVLISCPYIEDDNALNYDMDRGNDDITLTEFTRKGIELLDNPNGFFMMVEGGKIDWAAHANDASATIYDTLAMDTAIAEAKAFYDRHPDETLIIVTADHETGGMSIGYARTQYETYMNLLQNQKASYVAFNNQLAAFKKNNPNAKFEDVLPLIKEHFGLYILPQDELEAAQKAFKAGEDPKADDKAKAAAAEAKKKISLTLSDSEVAALKAAFEESMLPAEKRSKSDAAYLWYGGYEPLTMTLTHILDAKAGIGWTTSSHTGVPVQTSALGTGSDLFNGFYDNTEIYNKMVAAAGLK